MNPEKRKRAKKVMDQDNERMRIERELLRLEHDSVHPITGKPVPLIIDHMNPIGTLRDDKPIDKERMSKLVEDIKKAAANIEVVLPSLVMSPEVKRKLDRSIGRIREASLMMGLSMEKSFDRVERGTPKLTLAIGILEKMNRIARAGTILRGRNRIGGVIDDTAFSTKGTVPLTGRDTKMEQKERQYLYEELLAQLKKNIGHESVSPDTLTVIFNQVAQAAGQPKVAYRVNNEIPEPLWIELKELKEGEVAHNEPEMDLFGLVSKLESHMGKVPDATMTVVYNQIAGLVGGPQMQQVEGNDSVDNPEVSKWEKTGF